MSRYLIPATLALSLTLHAIAQDAQSPQPDPCSDTSTKAKVKRGFGSILRNTSVGQVLGSGNPDDPCPFKDKTKTIGGTSVILPPKHTAAAVQPVVGTSRIVTLDGVPMAIVTGNGEDNEPVTYLAGRNGPGTRIYLTDDPNVYATFDTKPTLYTVNPDDTLTVTKPQAPKPPIPLSEATDEPDPPQTISRTPAQTAGGELGKSDAGQIISNNIGIAWSPSPNHEFPAIFVTNGRLPKRTNPEEAGWGGIDKQGNKYVILVSGINGDTLALKISGSNAQTIVTRIATSHVPSDLDPSWNGVKPRGDDQAGVPMAGTDQQ